MPVAHLPNFFRRRFFLAVLVAGWACQSGAQSLREQEIAQCLPGEISTWADGRDQPAVGKTLLFRYSHAEAPDWFDAATVMAALEHAAAAWAGCGVPSRVVEAGAMADLPASGASRVVAVRWSESGSRSNFGLADTGAAALWLGPSPFALLRQRNPNYDAKAILQMVISHEMGHLYGVLAHSRRCVDVTSYYHDGKGAQCRVRGGGSMPPGIEYRASLPTACDIARCKRANGFAQ